MIVNGREIATQRGGYDEVSADITSALTSSGPQDLVIVVWTRPTPARKLGQTGQPAERHLVDGGHRHLADGLARACACAGDVDRRDAMTPNLDARVLHLTVQATGGDTDTIVAAVARDGSREVGARAVRQARPSTCHPFAEDVVARLAVPLRPGDLAQSRHARHPSRGRTSRCSKIALDTDSAGVRRLFLNNAPLFQIGPLDQGWWPDGLDTAPTDEALKSTPAPSSSTSASWTSCRRERPLVICRAYSGLILTYL